MPYQQGSGPQSQSGNPAVQDVYHSSNVYINNIEVALWNSPGSGSSGNYSPAITTGTFTSILSTTTSTVSSSVTV